MEYRVTPIQARRVTVVIGGYEMRRMMLVCVFGAIAFGAIAQQKSVTGKVTYVAAGTIYTSLGRDLGVSDSSMLRIVEGRDTIATLRVTAVSSKSSSCEIVSLMSGRTINIGAVVFATVEVATARAVDPVENATGTMDTSASSAHPTRRVSKAVEEPGAIAFKGRVSVQYNTTQFDISEYNITQPGVVLNLQAKARYIPISFDLYSNLRTLSYGSSSPFGGSAINQSRIYRLVLTFDDSLNRISVGRLSPVGAATIGYVDGAAVSRRVGDFTIGVVGGYQPSFSQRDISTDYKKAGLFISADLRSFTRGTLAMAYARTYFHTAIDREVGSAAMNLSLSNSLFIFANGELDFRRKSGNEYILSPSLTMVYFSANYRVTDQVTLGLGGDASRPVYSFNAIRALPDSLLERRMRSGATVSVSVRLLSTLTVYNAYTPRSSDSRFGAEFSDYASLSLANAGGTGVNVRTNLSINETAFTRSLGYGVNLQRNLAGFVDVTLRFQRQGYTLRKSDTRNNSTTLGVDAIIPIATAVTCFASYEHLDGYGTRSQSLFAELSLRF